MPVSSTTLPPLRRPLDDGLFMCTPATHDDMARVAAFNGQIFGAGLDAMTRALLDDFPDITWQDLIYVEDSRTGAIVSSLCLIPWPICYGQVTLMAGEMGIVGTLEGYRNRGLVRKQVDFFKERLRAHNCCLSLIQGIAYFYRQFGYTYALPLEGGLRLEGRELPQGVPPSFTFRRAGAEDMHVLAARFDAAAADLAIHTARTPGHWHYLLGPAQRTELSCEFWIVEDVRGDVEGYFRLPDHHFGEELVINEVSRLSHDAALAVLHWLVARARERSLPGVRLNLPAGCTLMRLARSLGARDLGTYAWQVFVPDWPMFLRTVAPTLEARLAASAFAGLTDRFAVSLYREHFTFVFDSGRLAAVERHPGAEAEFRCHPDAFAPLVLGQRTLAELRYQYPDVSIADRRQLLVETLFPPAAGFLYTCTG